MKKFKWSITPVMAFMLASCGLPEAYVRADRDTFNAITPEYESYVMGDQMLTAKDKEIRLRTVKIWDQRLKSAEKAVVK